MPCRFRAIIDTPPVLTSNSSAVAGRSVLGTSRDGAQIVGYRLGNPDGARVSLLAGCHADEPVGPRFLKHLVAYLAALPEGSDLMTAYDWWIVPDANPDGARANATWQLPGVSEYDLTECLAKVVRELPGDDIEFGFPRGPEDTDARPENRAIFEWWRSHDTPFLLHVTLHGMLKAAGPWFLIEPAWVERSAPLQNRMISAIEALGYRPHDVERNGEKGFRRVAPGFCTRPDSGAMSDFFEALGDLETAALFRPNSMETVRSFGGDPLTLVSELPLFLTPGVGEQLGPPDPVAMAWQERFDRWRAAVGERGDRETVLAEAATAGLRAMPVEDQMRFQWELLLSGLELASVER